MRRIALVVALSLLPVSVPAQQPDAVAAAIDRSTAEVVPRVMELAAASIDD